MQGLVGTAGPCSLQRDWGSLTGAAESRTALPMGCQLGTEDRSVASLSPYAVSHLQGLFCLLSLSPAGQPAFLYISVGFRKSKRGKCQASKGLGPELAQCHSLPHAMDKASLKASPGSRGPLFVAPLPF